MLSQKIFVSGLYHRSIIISELENKGGNTVNYSKRLFELCKEKEFNTEIAKELIKNVDLNSIILDEHTTFLITAVEYENTDMIKLLLKNGADPNFFPEDDLPALWNLQYYNFFETNQSELLYITQMLLESGANPNIVGDDESLFDYVAFSVFNEVEDDNWSYILNFFLYLIAYGGSSKYCTPVIYEEIDKRRLSEYDFIVEPTEDGKYLCGKIYRAGRLIADV